MVYHTLDMDGLVQDCGDSIANAPESPQSCTKSSKYHSDGLVQERRNSTALAMELRLSCTNPLIFESMKLQSEAI